MRRDFALPFLIVGTSLVAVAGCGSTSAELARQQLVLVTTQLESCRQLGTFVQQHPDPESESDITLFIPARTINAVFDGAKDLSVSLPSAKATITLKQLRVDFDCGSSTVTIDANAKRGSLEVDLVAAAAMDLLFNPADPTIATLKLNVASVVPRVKWGPFDAEIRGFARDLLQVKLGEWVASFPAISVPVRAQTPYGFPALDRAMSIPAASGRVDGRLTTGGLAGNATLEVSRIVFLADGIHCYFKATL